MVMIRGRKGSSEFLVFGKEISRSWENGVVSLFFRCY
jgi:hypothetical protein